MSWAERLALHTPPYPPIYGARAVVRANNGVFRQSTRAAQSSDFTRSTSSRNQTFCFSLMSQSSYKKSIPRICLHILVISTFGEMDDEYCSGVHSDCKNGFSGIELPGGSTLMVSRYTQTPFIEQM